MTRFSWMMKNDTEMENGTLGNPGQPWATLGNPGQPWATSWNGTLATLVTQATSLNGTLATLATEATSSNGYVANLATQATPWNGSEIGMENFNFTTNMSHWIDEEFELNINWMNPMSTIFELMIIVAAMIFFVVVGCARALERVRTLRSQIIGGSAEGNEDEPHGCIGGIHMHFSTGNDVDFQPDIGIGFEAGNDLELEPEIVIGSEANVD